MATVNLGAIKFNWKGAYNNSTAYAVDDVVSSGGNSYVCIQASTGNAVGNATAYWNIMSSAGTNGTDGTDLSSLLSTRGDLVFKNASALARLPKGTSGQVLGQGANDPAWVNGSSSTLTTQGDILYRDGSGLQRLAKGTAGKALVMNSSANAPEWGDAGGGTVLRVFTKSWFGGTSIGGASSSWRQINNYNTESITPLSSTSKFVIQWSISGYANDDHHFFKIVRRASNGSDTNIGLSSSGLANDNDYGDTGSLIYGRMTNSTPLKTFQIYDAPGSTSAFTYQLMNQAHGQTFYFGRSAHNPSNKQYASQNACIVWELDGSNTTFTNKANA